MLFKRMMIDGKGLVHQPGQVVPEGFSSPLGLAEMIKVGDIMDDPKQPEKEFDYLDVLNTTLNKPDQTETMELSDIKINQEPIQEPVKIVKAATKKSGRKAGK